jgi:hypothetical protein
MNDPNKIPDREGVTCLDWTGGVSPARFVRAVNVWLGRTNGDGDVAALIRTLA